MSAEREPRGVSTFSTLKFANKADAEAWIREQSAPSVHVIRELRKLGDAASEWIVLIPNDMSKVLHFVESEGDHSDADEDYAAWKETEGE